MLIIHIIPYPSFIQVFRKSFPTLMDFVNPGFYFEKILRRHAFRSLEELIKTPRATVLVFILVYKG